MLTVLSASLAAALAASIVAFGVRHAALRAGERRWRAAHPIAPDGIVPGADAITLHGGSTGVLLIHGFGDTPQSLGRLAHALHARGWTVHVPLLPGHGRTLEAFRTTNAAQWLSAARAAYEVMCAQHGPVGVVGLSMGGALAVSLTMSVTPPVPVLVLLTPYIDVSPSGRFLTAIWPLWSMWRAWVGGNAALSIHDPVARRQSLGYGQATPRLLRELRRVVDGAIAAARQLQPPTLAVFSRGDYRISVMAAERAFARIGSPIKAIEWVEQSGHVITVDFDADRVAAATSKWLERFLASDVASRD